MGFKVTGNYYVMPFSRITELDVARTAEFRSREDKHLIPPAVRRQYQLRPQPAVGGKRRRSKFHQICVPSHHALAWIDPYENQRSLVTRNPFHAAPHIIFISQLSASFSLYTPLPPSIYLRQLDNCCRLSHFTMLSRIQLAAALIGESVITAFITYK